MAEHIHWKKTTNPNYLGSYAFEKGKDLIVKLADVKVETVQKAQGSEVKNVLYFDGDVKPLILNTTNMKAIEKATGTPYMDEWVGKKLQLYVTVVSAFGDTMDAVRVRDFMPR